MVKHLSYIDPAPGIRALLYASSIRYLLHAPSGSRPQGRARIPQSRSPAPPNSKTNI